MARAHQLLHRSGIGEIYSLSVSYFLFYQYDLHISVPASVVFIVTGTSKSKSKGILLQQMQLFFACSFTIHFLLQKNLFIPMIWY